MFEYSLHSGKNNKTWDQKIITDEEACKGRVQLKNQVIVTTKTGSTNTFVTYLDSESSFLKMSSKTLPKP